MFHEEKNVENYIEKNNPYLYNTCRTKIIHETCIYSEICLSLTLNKPKFCINRTLNKVLMQKIFVNLTCINQTPVYFEHKSWSFGGSV